MKSINKKKIKKYFSFLIPFLIIPGFCRDYWRYLKYSGVMGGVNRGKLIGLIIAGYHVIEKGLTMPDVRLGFGKDNLIDLIEKCTAFINKYGGLSDFQVEHAVAIILEYRDFHISKHYSLDSKLLEKINILEAKVGKISPSQQPYYTKESFLSHDKDSFPLFSFSRKSVRNYSSKEIPMDQLIEAIKLAQNAPSACNRQTARVHICSDRQRMKEILDIQGANRGFGHLANKVIIITFDINVFHGLRERNAGFIDGGIFAMNLLYALHYYEIGACPLNCSLSIKAENRIKKICNIPKQETLVLMITCGYPNESFRNPLSIRYPVENILSKS